MGRVLDRYQLKEEVERLKKEGKRIVFTNGCFDIIHRGHIDYLSRAKTLGDVLIVGVNTDRSVQKLKPLRPINTEMDRATVVAALSMVDYVTLFSEETPYELIKTLRPDVLVKGGDWSIDRIVGADLVSEVHSLPYLEGYSTTSMIERVLERFGGISKATSSLLERARKVKFLVLDVDGVLTKGEIMLDSRDNEIKVFNVRDGHGLVMLRKSGVEIGVITGRQSVALERRMRELGISELYQGAREKLAVFCQILKKFELKEEEVAAVGDDIIDLSILTRVGLSAAPSDAHEEVKRRVDYVTKSKAGEGAVREICDLIIKSKGFWERFIDEYKNL